MSNTLQWNSFDNLGLAFGRDVLEHRIRLMGLVAVAIQRVYRKHRSCSMMGAPAATAVDRKVRARELAQAIGTLEYRTGKPLALRQVARWLRNTYQPAHLAAQLPGGALEFRGYEKIDGTNLGCADDGELYGRRLQVSGKSYQKASLKCMEPIRACVADVKRALAEIIAAEPKPGTVAVPARLIPDAYASELNDGNDEDKDEEEDAGDGGASAAAAAAAASGAAAENADNQNIAIDFANVDDILKRVQVRLYGELGVPGNDTKFGYNTRPIANHWYCFGIVFHVPTDDDLRALASRLRARGFWVVSDRDLRLTVTLSDPAVELLTRFNIPMPALKCRGTTLLETLRMGRDFVYSNMCEGVVIVGPQKLLVKWKSAVEDESNSKHVLSALLNTYALAPYMTQVEIDTATLLLEIASNVPAPTKSVKKEKEKAASGPSKVDDAAYETAFRSALTKYDSLDTFFAKNEMNKLVGMLQVELVGDLKPADAATEKEISARLRKSLGVMFGEWKKAQAGAGGSGKGKSKAAAADDDDNDA